MQEQICRRHFSSVVHIIKTFKQCVIKETTKNLESLALICGSLKEGDYVTTHVVEPSVAIVCSNIDGDKWFRLTDYGMKTISECNKRPHSHHTSAIRTIG